MRWFARRGLRVLMYHKLSPTRQDDLTVTCEQLEAQLTWLKEENFRFVSAATLWAAIEGESALPPMAVLVTFDDAYLDTLELGHPILHRLGIPAVVFVPTAFIGGTSSWDADARPLMNAPQLRQLAREGWELGLHSHQHLNYRNLSGAAIAADIRMGMHAFESLSLPAVSAFAYPFGGRPREAKARHALQEALVAAGIRTAFRIGNRVNRFPLRDAFEINRLGVRGDRAPAFFRRQIWWGRWF